MLTDASPRNASRAGYLESERIRTLDLPQDGCLLTIANAIESAMKTSHLAFSQVPLQQYEDDFLRGDVITPALLTGAGR